MVTIIAWITKFLNIINKLSFKLECFLLKFMPKDPSTIVMSEQYRKFKVNPAPIIKDSCLPITLDTAIAIYKEKHNGKEPKPIKRRVPATFPESTKCPHCGASHEFLFDNRSKNKSGQIRCKICDTAFALNKSYISQVAHYYPYCGKKLFAVHERSGFTVYKCRNKRCSYYTHNLKSLSKEEKNFTRTILLLSSFTISLAFLKLL